LFKKLSQLTNSLKLKNHFFKKYLRNYFFQKTKFHDELFYFHAPNSVKEVFQFTTHLQMLVSYILLLVKRAKVIEARDRCVFGILF